MFFLGHSVYDAKTSCTKNEILQLLPTTIINSAITGKKVYKTTGNNNLVVMFSKTTAISNGSTR